ncbi:hypothetical protein LTR17_001281 [Elasticomyces elasticus]|nr:hypothetical protein LTR17_001281 [Elasticomyces elasticus]
MPVTIKPGDTVPTLVQYTNQRSADHAREILRYACPRDQRKCLELLQSSFDGDVPPAFLPTSNGFVNAGITAYSRHHHLVIRPEDIWNAILTQLSFYINAHAEELRGQFVAHEGKKRLEVKYESGDRYTVDFADFAEKIGYLIEENVVDPELRKWMMPAFSTTTQHDIVVASIVMMASMQKYFEYYCMIMCGLPSVTLLGEKSDYELIATKLEKLCSYGEEPTAFCEGLRPIVRRFISSFDAPDAEKDFWGRMYKVEFQGSGPTIYSGWISAFCHWDEDGHLIPKRPIRRDASQIPTSGIHTIDKALVIDGVCYPRMKQDDVPSGFCKVPVVINDNGDEFDAEMIAGSIGMSYSSSGEGLEDGVVGLDTLQPKTGWWIYEKISIRGA